MNTSVAVIAIAGPSCSGKTTLVRALEAHWGVEHVATLPIDAYYRDHSHLPMEERLRCNFDAPEAIEWPLLTVHLKELRARRPVARPVYDYATHTRTGDSVLLDPRPILIVEGLFALWSEAVRAVAAALVYVDLPAETCLARRIARDAVERARTETQVRDQFTRHVQPMADRYILPTRAHANILLNGDAAIGESVKRIADFVKMATAESVPETAPDG